MLSFFPYVQLGIMTSPILWQNEQKTVTLIDIPRSIEAAQGTIPSRHLQSTVPLETPFATNEPKSASAKAKLQRHDIDDSLHAEYHDILRAAIDEVRAAHSTPWCLPRSFVTETPSISNKRKLNQDTPERGSTSQVVQASEASAVVRGTPGDPLPHLASASVKFRHCLATSPNSHLDDVTDRLEHTFSNIPDRATTICAIDNSNKDRNRCSFLVPPGSSFYLGNCADAKPFRDAVREQALVSNERHHFDLILLDPPWPNSSVKRTHHTPGSTYATSPSMSEMRNLLLDTKIDLLMAKDCLVGVWITNRPAVRDLVLGEDCLFECWDVELVEEWIWLKTTVRGEPGSDLDALWRKPYEVLLLGRIRQKATTIDREEAEASQKHVKKRVIIAVPDLHSRKPCLKELIEPLMTDSKKYRALEVFARCLVAGWWSWGDECIKFNWEGYWREGKRERTETSGVH